jgi:Fanconi-associated nuclease 1
LILRKPGQWFRLDKLKYISELGEQGIKDAIVELCTFPNYEASKDESSLPSSSSAPPSRKPSQADTAVIDLTLDSDEEMEQPVPSSSRTPPALEHSKSDPTPTILSSQSTATPSIFAQDESHATLDELVSCLNVDELKSIARMMKIAKPPTTVSLPCISIDFAV